MIEEIGCKPIITQDGISRPQMFPGIDKKQNPDGYRGFEKWLPFIKEELKNLKPDICVCDFFNVPGF
jgi:hypothetical protein